MPGKDQISSLFNSIPCELSGEIFYAEKRDLYGTEKPFTYAHLHMDEDWNRTPRFWGFWMAFLSASASLALSLSILCRLLIGPLLLFGLRKGWNYYMVESSVWFVCTPKQLAKPRQHAQTHTHTKRREEKEKAQNNKGPNLKIWIKFRNKIPHYICMNNLSAPSLRLPACLSTPPFQSPSSSVVEVPEGGRTLVDLSFSV